MNTISPPAAVTIGLGLSLIVVALQSFGAFGGPASMSPAPMTVFVFFFFLGPFAIVVPAVAFWLWNVNLFRGDIQFPTRSIVLQVLAGAAALVWHIAGFRNGYFHAGWAVASVLMFCAAFMGGLVCRRQPSFWLNATAHWLTFVWLTSYAFPWLGEPL